MFVPMKLKQLLVYATFLALGVSAHADVEAVAKLESATTDALDILYEEKYKDYSNEEKAVAVRAVLERDYDFMVLIRRTVGRNWKQLSNLEQIEVKDLVTKLVVKSFVEGVQGPERPMVSYGEPVMITDKRFEVASVVTFADGRVFNLVYRFGRLKTGWQIYDILAEEVSVVSNYRQQFDDHFRKGTGAELIEKLKELLEKDDLIEDDES